jgi:hypothetical protein
MLKRFELPGSNGRDTALIIAIIALVALVGVTAVLLYVRREK